MKGHFVLLAMMVAVGFAFYLVWNNRESEKIVTAVLPISVAALIGVFLAVLVFGGKPAIEEKFPVAFLYRTADRAPLAVPHRPLLNSLFEVPELQREHPALVGDNSQAGILYHHLLQKAIIDILAFRYKNNWEVEVTRFETASGQEMSFVPAAGSSGFTRLSHQQVQQLITGNRFSQSRATGLAMTLPPNTRMVVTVPLEGGEVRPEGEILLKNSFVTLRIKTYASWWRRGLGMYRLLTGFTEEQDREFTMAFYVVAIKAEFSRYRSGHPDMKRYKTWVEQITAELQRELDEQIVWSKTRDNYTFVKQIEQFGGPTVPTPPMFLNPPDIR